MQMVRTADQRKDLPLHAAACNGSSKVVSLLIPAMMEVIVLLPASVLFDAFSLGVLSGASLLLSWLPLFL